MGIIQTLATLTIAPLARIPFQEVGGSYLAEASANTIDKFINHFTNHTQTICEALVRANDRAWDCLELALADESWISSLKHRLNAKEKQAVAEQFRSFLPEIAGKNELRGKILDELRSARKTGVLDGTRLDSTNLPEELRSFLASTDFQQMKSRSDNQLRLISEELKQLGYINLALIAGQKTEDCSLLVNATRYFFRREVEKNPQLFRSITYSQLDSLDQSQQA